jgi:hypothetical protein
LEITRPAIFDYNKRLVLLSLISGGYCSSLVKTDQTLVIFILHELWECWFLEKISKRIFRNDFQSLILFHQTCDEIIWLIRSPFTIFFDSQFRNLTHFFRPWLKVHIDYIRKLTLCKYFPIFFSIKSWNEISNIWITFLRIL